MKKTKKQSIISILIIGFLINLTYNCGTKGASGSNASSGGGGGGGGNSTYSIGGTVTGLTAGDSLILQNNSGDDLSISANGAFTFRTKLTNNSKYNVQVLSATVAGGGICTAGYNFGAVNSSNVSNITVLCGLTTFTLKVNVTDAGVLGANLEFQNNNSDNLLVPTKGIATSFTRPMVSGSPYMVSILTKPTGEICTPNSTADVSGIMTANTTVNYTCTTAPNACLGPGTSSITVNFTRSHSYDVNSATGGGHKIYYDTINPPSTSYYIFVPNTASTYSGQIHGLSSGCTYYVKVGSYSALNPTGNVLSAVANITIP
ncbi:MAG: hypothetical protein OEV78_06005 [Spirochaetia bacterium]|nr:hypothetical protein [Spirochaetia bacterium]